MCVCFNDHLNFTIRQLCMYFLMQNRFLRAFCNFQTNSRMLVSEKKRPPPLPTSVFSVFKPENHFFCFHISLNSNHEYKSALFISREYQRFVYDQITEIATKTILKQNYGNCKLICSQFQKLKKKLGNRRKVLCLRNRKNQWKLTKKNSSKAQNPKTGGRPC